MFFRSQQELKTIDTPMVTLKNGTEVTKSFVNLVMRSLEELSRINYGALCQLVGKCNDASFEIKCPAKEVLEKLGLIDSLGSINLDTQNIILSAFMGIDPDASMALSDPIAPSDASMGLSDPNAALSRKAKL